MPSIKQKRYLYAIYALGKGRPVRSSEVSRLLGVTKASTVKMTRRLEEDGYIEKAPYREIRLTEKGLEAGEGIYEPCRLVVRFLKEKLGIPGDRAREEGLSMVTEVSEETAQAIGRTLGKLCEK